MAKFNAKKRLAQLKAYDAELEKVIADKKDSTLIDYVRWVGGFDFNARPVCDADILVMCVLSYFDFDPALNAKDDELVLKDALPLLNAGAVKLQITGADMGNSDIARYALASRRFGELKLRHYTDILSAAPPVQFSAMTLYSDTGFSVICYRGTDSSLAGWKENFLISVERTKAQELAEEYARKYIDKSCSWYIAGHSKGANLALCAALALDPCELDLVKRIYLLDGPGLCPEVAEAGAVQRIDSKTTRIIPEFDVIGKLFEPNITDTKIVRSFRRGITQHSLASWMTDHGDLALCETNAAGSAFLNELMDEWISGVDLSERKLFIDELFESMSVDGVEYLTDVTAEYYGNMLLSLIGKSKQTKHILGGIPKRLFFDGVFDELEQKNIFSARQYDFFYAAGIMIFGAAMILLSSKLLEIVSVAIVAALLLFQIFTVIRRIFILKRIGEGTRMRIILTIVVAGLLAIILIKPEALYILGSMIFATIFTAGAFVSAEGFSGSKRLFMKVLCVIETVAAALLAIAFFTIPYSMVKTVALISGIVLLADGLSRFIFLTVDAIKERTLGKRR